MYSNAHVICKQDTQGLIPCGITPLIATSIFYYSMMIHVI